MNRRGFLTRSGLALGVLMVGDEVLEAFERLTYRKVWAGHDFTESVRDPIAFARYYLGITPTPSQEVQMRSLQFSRHPY